MNSFKLTSKSSVIKPAELIFAISMLLIITFSFGDYYQAMRLNPEHDEIEQAITNQKRVTEESLQPEIAMETNAKPSLPLFIMFLLLISYCALGGGMYIAREIRR